MLMKNELLAIPLTAMPAIRKSNRDYKFAADAAVNNLPQSGKILSVDIYDTSKVLILRFFSDGKNFINYLPQQKEWNSNKVSDNLSRWDYDYIFSTKKASELVHKVINEKLASRLCHSGISGELDAFSENVKSQKYQNVVKRRQELQGAISLCFRRFQKILKAIAKSKFFCIPIFLSAKLRKGTVPLNALPAGIYSQ